MIKITDEEFHALAAYIKNHSGIHLREEKRTLLSGRLNGILTERNIESFTQYYKLLQEDRSGRELSTLIDRITTNHTFFMREAQHFDYLKEKVLPEVTRSIRDRDLRIWCAAASTGEEPYTLAFLLDEFFGEKAGQWDKRLLATDISEHVLAKAKQGIYSQEQVSTLPKRWVLQGFDRLQTGQYRIKESCRTSVIFRRFNLLEGIFPFKKKFHVIFCRNVMIYFDAKTKQALVEKLYDSLEHGGYLFIGHSESIDREKTRFQYIKPAVYRKI